MRDHQPTGGYPRIATIVSADLDRFAQLRPSTQLRFLPVTLEHAR
jgi:allophanate hydrolase subunit 2